MDIAELETKLLEVKSNSIRRQDRMTEIYAKAGGVDDIRDIEVIGLAKEALGEVNDCYRLALKDISVLISIIGELIKEREF